MVRFTQDFPPKEVKVIIKIVIVFWRPPSRVPLSMLWLHLSSIATQVPQADIVILISDFIADLDKFALALGQMNFIGHDLIIFHVADPLERDFSYGGQTIFIGPENEGKLLCDPRDLRSAYLKEREDHIGEVRKICRRSGYELENMFTDTPLDATLSGIIANRAARKMAR